MLSQGEVALCSAGLEEERDRNAVCSILWAAHACPFAAGKRSCDVAACRAMAKVSRSREMPLPNPAFLDACLYRYTHILKKDNVQSLHKSFARSPYVTKDISTSTEGAETMWKAVQTPGCQEGHRERGSVGTFCAKTCCWCTGQGRGCPGVRRRRRRRRRRRAGAAARLSAAGHRGTRWDRSWVTLGRKAGETGSRCAQRVAWQEEQVAMFTFTGKYFK